MSVFSGIDLEDAARRNWDVIICGSSFAAMFFLRGLPSGLDILILEKGSFFDHFELTENDIVPPDDIPLDNTSGIEKTFPVRTMFGGNSNYWTGQTPRFLPSDFTLFEDTGRAAPWPIRYNTLSPFYDEVEAIMEVCGDASTSPSPMSTEYEYPPHTPGRADAVCRDKRPDIWFPAPTARSNGGSRPNCCDNEVCGRCPIDAKYTVLNGIDAFVRPEVRLALNATVTRVGIRDARADRVLVKNNGSEVEIKGGVIALAASAIHNPAILLRSGIKHPALGRYLHEQIGQKIIVDTDQPSFFGGTLIPTLGHHFWSNADRKSRAAVMIEVFNRIHPARPLAGRWTERMGIRIVAEDEPLKENRVKLDASGAPVLEWHGFSNYAWDGLAHAAENLDEAFPFTVESTRVSAPDTTEYHVQGTHRMGADGDTAVVDAFQRLHTTPNLYVLGAGSFPTCSPANPTLTLSALSLMAGRSL